MVYILVELFLFTYQLYKKNNKIIGLLGLIFLGYLCGTVERQVNDYAIYEASYYQVGIQGPSVSIFEKGYTNLEYFTYCLGMNYQQFRFLFAILTILVLFWGVSRFTSNVCLFSSIFGCSIFFVDAIQVRSFMTISLVILAMSFLKKINLKNVCISTFIILISAQFQSLGYLFLSIILIRILMEKGKINLLNVFIISNTIYVLFILLGRIRITGIIGMLASLTGGRINLLSKITTQYIYGASLKNLIIVFIITWITVLLSRRVILLLNIQYNEKIKILYSGIISSTFILPFTYLAIDYARYSRGCAVFFIILSCIVFSKLKETKLTIYIPMIFAMLIINGLYYNLMWGHAFLESIPRILKLN